ncbi:MAG TPA: helix-turn-helix transcriptional regulator [Thermoanaerobaculia bacterium]|nr:helix-turn-helix transcriptional regulator [Thermoanaerobaculia bacterium]
MTNDPTSVGPTLRRLRTDRDIALVAVAEQAGISVATLSRVETNKQSIDVALLFTLARILGTSPADILNSGDDREDIESLSRRVAALPPEARTKVFRKSSASRKPKQIQPVLDELISTVDMMREELLTVQRAMRGRYKKR